MSVEIYATRDHRPSSLPCRETGQGGSAAVVMIRVAGRTFTSECSNMDEAAEIAKRIDAELAQHYEERRQRG